MFSMIDGIGKAGASRLELARSTTEKAAAVAKTAAEQAAAMPTEPVTSPFKEMASLGPPFDVKKVQELRQEIAQNSYRTDPDLIAPAYAVT
jgi:anti-sigma28 factor (negative regulator of flagellin synthesis)